MKQTEITESTLLHVFSAGIKIKRNAHRGGICFAKDHRYAVGFITRSRQTRNVLLSRDVAYGATQRVGPRLGTSAYLAQLNARIVGLKNRVGKHRHRF